MSNKKTVVCVFGVRKKKVIFETEDVGGKSDSHNLKEALHASAKTDVDLNEKLLASSRIHLQMVDPSLPELGPIDIEEDENIPHGSLVHVQFETCSLPNVNELILVDENGKEIVCEKEIGMKENPSVDIPKALPTTDGTTIDERNSTHILQEQLVVVGDSMNVNYSSEDEPDTSQNGSFNSSICRKNDLPLRKTKIFPSSPLPSSEGTPLEEFRTSEEVLLHLDEFVRYWTSDLSKHTDGNPLPSDYKNYALNIIDVYPFLGHSIKKMVGDETSTVINHRPLAKKLSACLRNRKHWPALKLKRKALKGSSSNAAEDPGTSDSSSLSSNRPKLVNKLPSPASSSVSRKRTTANRPSLSHPRGSDFVCSDAQHREFQLELEGTRDSNHKKLLMDATRYRRRKFVKEALGLPAIVKEYSALQDTEMLLYEFNKVVPSALERINKNLPVLIDKLSSFFKMPAEKTGEEFAVLIRLQEALAPNKSYGNQPVITINKAFGDTTRLRAQLSESLKLEVFVNVDVVSCAFVVGETLQWEIPTPVTTSQCVATLLGAYHAFDRCYPFAYHNVMTFFDIHLLGLPPIKPTAKLLKFEQLLSVSKK